jgi:hypothetical protein
MQSMKAADERALIANYQNLGLYQGGLVTILGPKMKVTQRIAGTGQSSPELSEAVRQQLEVTAAAYYQGASYGYAHRMDGRSTIPDRTP